MVSRRAGSVLSRPVTVNTFITVFDEITWDIHGSKPFTSIEGMKQIVCPMYDQGYTALIEDQEYSPIRPLVDWLDYNGYTMVTKPLKEFTQSTGRRKFKGNMDVEITVDVMEMSANVDHVVLISGDGDFRRLVEAVQRRARRL